MWLSLIFGIVIILIISIIVYNSRANRNKNRKSDYLNDIK